MNEKSICIIKTKISHVAENNTLKKVLFNVDKICNRSIIFAAVGLKMTFSAILLS